MPINYEEYPPNWKTEIVPRILKRADNRCENCDLVNGTTAFAVSLKIYDDDTGRYKPKTFWFEIWNAAYRVAGFNRERVTERTVRLQVCHLDHDHENHNVTDDRLMAMCQLCHINYDAKVKYERQQSGFYNGGVNKNPLKRGAA